MMKKILIITLLFIVILSATAVSANDNLTSDKLSQNPIFDDKITLETEDNLEQSSERYTPPEKNVKNVSIEIQNKIYLDYYQYKWDDDASEWIKDSAFVILPKDATGIVNITVNNILYKSFDVKNAKYIDKYKNDNKIIYTYFDDLKYGFYDVEVVYSGNYGTISKDETVDISYYFNFYYPFGEDKLICEENGVIFFLLPSDIKGKISAFIDGENVNYDVNKVIPGTPSRSPNYYDGCVFDFAPVYLDNLQIGRHNITIKYSGDKKYPARSISENFEIYVLPDYDYQCAFKSICPITINLPEGNIGNFTVYISEEGKNNFTLIDCVNLTKGSATIYYNCTKMGEFEIKSKYETNHGMHEYLSDLTVSCIEYENPYKTYYLNSNYKITATLPKDAVGNFTLYVWKDDKKIVYKRVNIVNGKATIYFKAKNEDCIGFDAVCISNYGKDSKFEAVYFVDGSKITASANNVFYNDALKYTMKVYGKDNKLVSKNTAVTVKIGSTTINTKTNAKGVATVNIPKLNPGTYTITVKYLNTKVTKKLTVKHLVTLKTVTVKKSAKKLTLEATLKNTKAIKGKTVTFKFNGKTYKAKTNNKGIAKITIPKSVLSKLKTGKTVTYHATYLKDTVKKTVKVKK